MRHLKDGRKFGINTAHRTAMFRNMVTSLLRFEKISTTLARAKELRRYAEKMITLGKKGDLAARRKAAGYLQDKAVTSKLFAALGKRYAERKGGYTRIYRAGLRNGDNAPMAIIELVDRDVAAEPKRRTRKVEEAEAAAK
ncbi:MAG: 50S ribosomal protein L17 [Nitrospinae bacterium]|nr:50S ribosomal protein L17 [Nitrospinota bacterium]